MDDIVVDTNIIIWHFSDPTQLSKFAEKAIDTSESLGTIFVASITIVELIYLIEKSRIPQDVLDLLRIALEDSTTSFRLVGLDQAIADEVSYIPRSMIPDMPDRIIAATALYLDLPLVTKDERIRAVESVRTIW